MTVCCSVFTGRVADVFLQPYSVQWRMLLNNKAKFFFVVLWDARYFPKMPFLMAVIFQSPYAEICCTLF